MRVDTAAWMASASETMRLTISPVDRSEKKRWLWIDQPLVQLVAQIAHRREADLLERVLGEERRERADDEDDQQRQQDACGTCSRGSAVPPVVKAPVDVDRRALIEPAALPFRLVAFEDGVDDALLRRLLARRMRPTTCAARRAA